MARECVPVRRMHTNGITAVIIIYKLHKLPVKVGNFAVSRDPSSPEPSRHGAIGYCRQSCPVRLQPTGQQGCTVNHSHFSALLIARQARM